MCAYYIDTEGVSAVDPDGNGLNLPLDVTNQVYARVYRENNLIQEQHNISPPVGQPWNWETPISLDAAGSYRIEYIVTDERGGTTIAVRNITISDGLGVTTDSYLNLFNSVDEGMYQAGLEQSLSSDGKWACCNVHGHWAGDDFADPPFPTINYNDFGTRKSHGSMVFNVDSPNDVYFMSARDLLGFTDYDLFSLSANNNKILNQQPGTYKVSRKYTMGTRIRWMYKEVVHERIVENVGDDFISVYEPIIAGENFRTQGDLQAIFTNAYSEPPGKSGQIGDIANPDDTSPSIVPREPIVINGSAYTKARDRFGHSGELSSEYYPEGIAWTMRRTNNEWIVDGIFPSLFSLSRSSYHKWGICVKISKDGSTVAVASEGSVSIYKRNAVFSHLIFQGILPYYGSEAPAIPSTSNTREPTGWTENFSDLDPIFDNFGTPKRVWVSRGKTSDGGQTYSWGTPYRVSDYDTVNLKDVTNSSPILHGCTQDSITPSTYAEYGWQLVGTINLSESNPPARMDFSKNGNRIVIGAPSLSSRANRVGGGKVYIYQYNGGTSWSLIGDINGVLGTITYGSTSSGNNYSRGFGSKVSCDDDCNIVVVGGSGWYVKDRAEILTGKASETGWSRFRYSDLMSGCVNCFVYKNGEWRTDSIKNSLESHRDTGGSLNIPTQTSTCPDLYGQEYIVSGDEIKRFGLRHGQDVKISGDGQRMYVVSQRTPYFPKVQVWSRDKTYSKDELVEIFGNIYQSKFDNNNNRFPSSTSSYWQVLGNEEGQVLARWMLGGSNDDDSLNVNIGLVFVYKKQNDSSLISGFYWKFDRFLLPPKVLGYNGWYTKGLDSVAVSDDPYKVLIGSSTWYKKYISGESGRAGDDVAGSFEDLEIPETNSNQGLWISPGGWAFVEDNLINSNFASVRSIDDDNFNDFAQSESTKVGSLLPEVYLGYPDPLSSLYGGKLVALRSHSAGDSIIFIFHNTSFQSIVSQKYYRIHDGSTYSTNYNYPITTVNIEKYSNFQPVVIAGSSGSIKVVTRSSTGKNSTSFSEIAYLSNRSGGLAPIQVINTSINYQYPQFATLNWTQDIENSNWDNQSDEHVITYKINGELQEKEYSVRPEYLQVNQSFRFQDLQYGIYSSLAGSNEVAKVYTFYMQQKNQYGQSSLQTFGSIYTYDWDIGVPGKPILFSMQINGLIASVDLKIPYSGYQGGKPETLVFYINTTGSMPLDFSNIYKTGESSINFDQYENIQTDGFLHIMNPDLGGFQFQSGTRYYIWVRAENEDGSSGWVASQTNDGGVQA